MQRTALESQSGSCLRAKNKDTRAIPAAAAPAAAQVHDHERFEAGIEASRRTTTCVSASHAAVKTRAPRCTDATASWDVRGTAGVLRNKGRSDRTRCDDSAERAPSLAARFLLTGESVWRFCFVAASPSGPLKRAAGLLAGRTLRTEVRTAGRGATLGARLAKGRGQRCRRVSAA